MLPAGWMGGPIMARKPSLIRLLTSGPKRQQLRCSGCGYTWHPRGHAVSLVCPNCRSKLSPPRKNLLGYLVFMVIVLAAGYTCHGGASAPQERAAETPSAQEAKPVPPPKVATKPGRKGP